MRDGNTQWLIFHNWQVPPGYTAETVNIALLIPGNYSDSQIDMVYFKPALARKDGKAINALTSQVIEGGTWQRRSRHRSVTHPWRPVVDDVASHLTLVDEWLWREHFPKAAWNSRFA